MESEDYKEEKRQRVWSDPDEKAKYVCQGGKIQCAYCSPPIADIIVTSTTVKLQDKPWATVEDNDGQKNFNFTGVCTHPSQQKPGSPPPPCKAVIKLGKWKGFSKTLVDGKNALLAGSTIPCMISGQDLTIAHSGQKATLTKIEPKVKRTPKVVDVYWREDGKDEKLYVEYPDYPVTMYIETEDYKPGEFVKLQLTGKEGRLFKGNKKELVVRGKVGSDGVCVINNFKVEYEKNTSI